MRILSEVAVAGISMLVSSDFYLLSVLKDRLDELLVAKDLAPVAAFAPKSIVHALAPRRRSY